MEGNHRIGLDELINQRQQTPGSDCKISHIHHRQFGKSTAFIAAILRCLGTTN
jgi:hypothetical protein